MGDHFVLLVDRLLTEATLEAAIESINQRSETAITTMSIVDKETDFSLQKKFAGEKLMFSGKLVECRICQDEDEDSNMEIPCSCSGSLQFAHRKCVQKWCNEKGDIRCEICLQQFKPGYTAPPKLFLYGTTPMSFRGNWEISRRDIDNHQYITMAPTDRAISGHNYDDYAASHATSTMYCRVVAATFMVVLILRHSLGAYQYSIPLFILLLLRIAGIVLPLYIISRAVTTICQRRRRLQGVYHAWLLFTILKHPDRTVIGLNTQVRRQWIEAMIADPIKNGVLAVQTVRNDIMASIVLGTTSITLASLITVFVNATTAPITSAFVYGSKSSSASSAKLFAISLCFLLSFVCNIQAIRYYTHVSFLITRPASPEGSDSGAGSVEYTVRSFSRGSHFWSLGLRAFYVAFTLFLLLFGPIPMVASSAAMCCLLFFLDTTTDFTRALHSRAVLKIANDV